MLFRIIIAICLEKQILRNTLISYVTLSHLRSKEVQCHESDAAQLTYLLECNNKLSAHLLTVQCLDVALPSVLTTRQNIPKLIFPFNAKS